MKGNGVISIITIIIEGTFNLFSHIFHGAGTGALQNGEHAGSVSTKRIFGVLSGIGVLIAICIAAIIGMGAEDKNKTFSWYLEQIEDNDNPKPEYLNALGECYLYGRDIDVDYDSAFSYFQKAAEGKSSESYYNLGVCYSNGYGTDVDDEKALEYFQLAEDENIEAKAYVGYYNYRGWGGLEINKEKAMEIYKLCENKDSVMSLFFQAIYYLYEKDIDDHYKKAVEFCS